MIRFATKARTALRLGVPNLLRAAVYRMGVKSGLSSVRKLKGVPPQGPFFSQPNQGPLSVPAISTWDQAGMMFSRWPIPVTRHPPNWLANPFTGRPIHDPSRVWWQIPDFDPTVGDIKLIWELSRMDWVLAFAQRARNGDAEALERLNDWLDDWCRQNPPYCGPNWKCGQEASIRVMNLAMAALILGQTASCQTGLKELVQLHLRRIAPTMQYAVAQDNNHGTSEAAALYIGGGWLAAVGENEGERWQRLGRHWLENRAVRLIGEQGSFSQYSLNYHRVMLDSYCMAEVWRRHFDLPSFSPALCQRLSAAAQWLRHMINEDNGDGPNVGANDGARLLQLSDADYRDYRPSVQLAMVLFCGQKAYEGHGQWDAPLIWLNVPVPDALAPPPRSYIADDGGFALLRRGSATVMLRYPRFRFRPSQADALHLDLWYDGKNLLRDAGTYSYNTEPEWLNYFGGTASHNTVQFDGRDQMPRLSRFLFGDWLSTIHVEPLSEEAEGVHFAAAYQDADAARQMRRVSLGDSGLRVIDVVEGFRHKAVLRWRLAPAAWRMDRSSGCVKLTNGLHVLTLKSDAPIVRCELVEGWESRHYLEKVPVPVLEAEIDQPGTLITEYAWGK